MLMPVTVTPDGIDDLKRIAYLRASGLGGPEVGTAALTQPLEEMYTAQPDVMLKRFGVVRKTDGSLLGAVSLRTWTDPDPANSAQVLAAASAHNVQVATLLSALGTDKPCSLESGEAVLEYVSVVPGAAGMGVGDSLRTWVTQEWAKKQGVSRVITYASSGAVIRALGKQGFHPTADSGTSVPKFGCCGLFKSSQPSSPVKLVYSVS